MSNTFLWIAFFVEFILSLKICINFVYLTANLKYATVFCHLTVLTFNHLFLLTNMKTNPVDDIIACFNICVIYTTVYSFIFHLFWIKKEIWQKILFSLYLLPRPQGLYYHFICHYITWHSVAIIWQHFFNI